MEMYSTWNKAAFFFISDMLSSPKFGSSNGSKGWLNPTNLATSDNRNIRKKFGITGVYIGFCIGGGQGANGDTFSLEKNFFAFLNSKIFK